MNTSVNAKIGWGIAAVVAVIALIALAVIERQTPVLPAVEPVGTSTEAVATSTPSVPVAHVAAPVAPAPYLPVSVAADGTILFSAPASTTLAVGKVAVERATGYRVTLKKIETVQKTRNSEPKATVAVISLNTGACTSGICSSRQDTAQQVMFSVGQTVSLNGYVVTLSALTTTEATLFIQKTL